jgi:2-polyprenyl-3-methyl-5-hydroxy-6-metoxy-1,4-benzoquinol methylase
MDDDIARKYDAAASTYSSRYADPDAVAAFFVGLVRTWGSAPPRDARILEVSCADGFMTAALVREGYRVSAIDIAPMMVKAARDRLSRAGLTADIQVADVRTFEPASPWDVILAPMWTFFAYVDHPEPVLGRLANALAPGGRLIVDRNPRTHPVAAGVAALTHAGLTEVEWRPVPVPLKKRLGPVAAAGLRTALAVPPIRDAVLRRRLNVVLMGRKPEYPSANQ